MTRRHGLYLTRYVVLSLMVAASLLAGGALADSGGLTLSVGTGYAQVGQAAEVPVSLAANGTQPASMVLSVAYDAAKLTFLSADAGDAATAAGKQVSPGTPANGKVKLVLMGLNENVMADGVVLKLHFTVAAGNTGDNITIGLESASASTPGPVPQGIPVAASNGAVIIGEKPAGCYGTAGPGAPASAGRLAGDGLLLGLVVLVLLAAGARRVRS